MKVSLEEEEETYMVGVATTVTLARRELVMIIEELALVYRNRRFLRLIESSIYYPTLGKNQNVGLISMCLSRTITICKDFQPLKVERLSTYRLRVKCIPSYALKPSRAV